MMPDLARIYDADFFREWGPANADYVRSAGLITEEIHRQFRPRRVADIGCGGGIYSRLLMDRGAEVLSIDGVVPPPEHSFGVAVHRQDLTEPFANVWGEFDLALCLEVAEHIPEELCGAFLDNLTRFSATLLLSAAPPDQGGRHHVNEQPKRYWVRQLAARGFAYSRRRTGRLETAFRALRLPYMWMGSQLSVYEKALADGRPRQGLPFSAKLRRAPEGA